MSEKCEDQIVPQAMAEMEWVWVLVTPITKHRESIFILDINERPGGDQRRIVPIFEKREDAAKLKVHLCQNKPQDYHEQAMRLSDVGSFAAKNNLEIMLLDETGVIVAHMEAKFEQVSVH